MQANATANAPAAQQGPAHDFPRWRCATIASVVLFIIAGLFMVLGLGLDDVMNADVEQPILGVEFHTRVGFFTSEICVAGNCNSEATIDSLTCGNKSLMDTGAAFYFLGFFASLAVIFSNCWELAKQKELLPHMTLVLQVIAGSLLFVANLPLAKVRSDAKFSDSCTTVIPGLVRYGLGPTWSVGPIVSLLLVFTAFLTYLFRRYVGCCQCCCAYQDPNALPPPQQQQQGVAMQPVAGQPVQGQPVYAQQQGQYPAAQPQPQQQPWAYAYGQQGPPGYGGNQAPPPNAQYPPASYAGQAPPPGYGQQPQPAATMYGGQQGPAYAAGAPPPKAAA